MVTFHRRKAFHYLLMKIQQRLLKIPRFLVLPSEAVAAEAVWGLLSLLSLF
jgi:hypothetical protein